MSVECFLRFDSLVVGVLGTLGSVGVVVFLVMFKF